MPTGLEKNRWKLDFNNGFYPETSEAIGSDLRHDRIGMHDHG
jgi:hypothetical protein